MVTNTKSFKMDYQTDPQYIGYYAKINGHPSTVPFFQNFIRQPYTNGGGTLITEEIIFDNTELYRVYSGDGGRFMDIDYVNEAT